MEQDVPIQNPVQNALDKYLVVIANAVNAWMAENTPEVVTRRVKNLLDKNSDEITKKLLGFRSDWASSEWEIDHTNGRSGNSAAGDYLLKHQSQAVKEWLSQVKMPTFTAKFQKDVEKELQRNYEQAASTSLWSLGRVKAQKDMEALVEQITKSKNINNYLKVQALISSTPPTNQD